jgi:DNA-binding response OmpR family regulator
MTSTVPPLIVLVEDDARLAELVRTYLQSNGFRVSVEGRGDRVVERVRRESPDLIILDLGLPGQDGFSICREIRSSLAIPILILTARNNDVDQVLGLELGADDYVIKPVVPRVLIARIHALLRRRQSEHAERTVLQFGGLVIDPAARSVTHEARQVPLSSNEFDLLLYLASHPGEIQTRERLYRQLYGRDYDGIDRTLDVRISQLRRKLGDTGDTEKIRTVWGHGYLFVADAW